MAACHHDSRVSHWRPFALCKWGTLNGSNANQRSPQRVSAPAVVPDLCVSCLSLTVNFYEHRHFLKELKVDEVEIAAIQQEKRQKHGHKVKHVGKYVDGEWHGRESYEPVKLIDERPDGKCHDPDSDSPEQTRKTACTKAVVLAAEAATAS